MTQGGDNLSRYIVGIDLGTTNCSVGYIDSSEAAWTVRDFAVAQLVAPGMVEARETLPSFHYQPAAGELADGTLRLPWSNRGESHAVGIFAREQGAAAPGRLISSAKSWLCHNGIDRTAAVLPWHGGEDVERLSPVQVSARYLEHICRAWDDAHPEHRLSMQEVVLTVPASFDEVARELTIEAARQAGLVSLTLVEEPQAAFYAWIHAQGEAWHDHVRPGEKILICDIGGGTTDFTLIRVKPAGEGKIVFHRIAVGQHLLLGGDNLDLAVAYHVEKKLSPNEKLPPRQWGALLRSSRAIKETFLAEDAPAQQKVSIGGGGAKLVGGARQVTVDRDEIRELLLEGFLPRVGLDSRPTQRRSGFQELNLPYAPDPAITRYLAAFLSAHRDAAIDADEVIHLEHDPARPDVILFNGGFFASPILRQRLVEVIASWFDYGDRNSAEHLTPLPALLSNPRLDLAVSRGAAYYGMVRRGHGVRIRGGLAHSYYVGVDVGETEPDAPEEQTVDSTAICLLPAGVEEGHEVRLPRAFALLIRQPVEFPLFMSATRTTDAPGQLVGIDPEQLTALPPIRTVLQSGRKSAADVVHVNLHARLTAIGTLELWAQEITGERQWRLQFDVRSATHAEIARHKGQLEEQGFVEAQLIGPAHDLIRSAFTSGRAKKPISTAPTPASLIKRLELLSGMPRHDWPPSLLRSFWESLFEVHESRGESVDHEARWLNFAGFCLRPGYGLAVDDWRVAQSWRLMPQKVRHPRNELCRAEWWILWRRIAGGLSPGQQTTLAEPLIAALKSRLRPAGPVTRLKTAPFQYGAHESAEVWRLLGSLELLKPSNKVELGQLILELLPREKTVAVAGASLFALGRLGSRVPVYGPLNLLVEPPIVESWTEQLLSGWAAFSAETQAQALFTLVQLTRRTEDRYRDISDAARNAVVAHLRTNDAPGHYLKLVLEGGGLEEAEQKLTFGESLPRGLRID